MSDSAIRIGSDVLLRSVVYSPPNPRVGESVLVEVKAPDGRVYTPDDVVAVSMNGTPGSRQWLQWAKPGPKRIFVIVRKTGRPPERKLITLDVKAPSGEADIFPILRIEQRLDQPYRVDIRLEGLPSRALPMRPSGIARPATTMASQGKPHGNATVTLDSTTVTPNCHWDFGDGKIGAGLRSVISHDFGPSLSPDRLRQSFDIAATVLLPGGRTVHVTRTVTFLNHYAYAKQRGLIQPPVTSNLNAVLDGGQFHATLTVQNLESTSIVLNARQILPILDDGPALPMRREACHFSVPGKASLKIPVAIPVAKIPRDASGFAVHFSGLMGRSPVRCSACFDIPERFHRSSLTLSAQTLGFLNGLIASNRSPALMP